MVLGGWIYLTNEYDCEYEYESDYENGMEDEDKYICFNELLPENLCDTAYEKPRDFFNHFEKELSVEMPERLFDDEDFYEGEESLLLRREYIKYPVDFSIPYDMINQVKQLERLETLCFSANYRMVFSPFLTKEKIIELEKFYVKVRLSRIIGDLELRKLNEINHVKVGIVPIVEFDFD